MFFGAGASAAFGYPTMDGILPLFSKELTGEEKEFFDQVWKLVSESYSYVDLESVFSVIDVISRDYSFGELGPVSAFHARKYFNWDKTAAESRPDQGDIRIANRIREKFRKFIRTHYQVRPNEQDRMDAIYSQFFSLLTKRPGYDSTSSHGTLSFRDWPMFTTNYDLIIETVFANRDATLNTGAVASKTGQFMTLDTSVLRTAGSSIQSPKPMLVKLHGSLNWVKVGRGIRVESRPSDSEFTLDGRRAEGEVVLYPIIGKELYRYPFLDLFQLLQNELKRNETWIVVGYQFNDEIIRNMFLESFSQDKQMILIHPRPDKILEKQLDPVKARVKCVRTEFGDPVNLPQQLEPLISKA
jgi:hypothetical protein